MTAFHKMPGLLPFNFVNIITIFIYKSQFSPTFKGEEDVFGPNAGAITRGRNKPKGLKMVLTNSHRATFIILNHFFFKTITPLQNSLNKNIMQGWFLHVNFFNRKPGSNTLQHFVEALPAPVAEKSPAAVYLEI